MLDGTQNSLLESFTSLALHTDTMPLFKFITPSTIFHLSQLININFLQEKLVHIPTYPAKYMTKYSWMSQKCKAHS